MISVVSVVKPIAGAIVVIVVITTLHDQISDAGVRSALGWGAASIVTESISALWARATTRREPLSSEPQGAVLAIGSGPAEVMPAEAMPTEAMPAEEIGRPPVRQVMSEQVSRN